MNILNIEHISKIYGEKVIFEDASFGVQEGDKVGIIGINGTGKSTLLKMLAGEEVPETGQIIMQNNVRLAYLPQNPQFPENIIGINGTGKSTLLKMLAGEEVPETGQIIMQNNVRLAYLPQNPQFPENATILSYIQDCEAEWKVQSNLTQLGITEYEKQIAVLSGGQRRKVALAKILAQDFDILLLDEPTNHLDEAMISWLEEYLKSFRGTVLMVTHDRYFMDKVTNRILEISHGKMYSYEANYSKFLELKAEREEMELASERKRQSVLRMELEWAKRGCRARTTKQRARLERLEALKNTAAPVGDQSVELESVETRMGKKTIELKHVSKKYGNQVLVEDFNYILLKNQKLGIIGPNGCGKSTLMKLMAGLVEPDSGTVEMGETIKIGYFAQEEQEMDERQRVIDYVKDIAEYINTKDGKISSGTVEMGETIKIGYFAQEEQEMDERQRVIDYVKDIAEYINTKDGKISASQMLERFLFTPDMQYAPIGKLSGGEKRRLYLLGVLSSEINVLLLDEPGNNLDIPTLTILEDYLNSFTGIVVTVSHDRYFLDNVVDRIFEFRNCSDGFP